MEAKKPLSKMWTMLMGLRVERCTASITFLMVGRFTINHDE